MLRYNRNKFIAFFQYLWFNSYPVKLYYWYNHKKTMSWLHNEYETNPKFAQSMVDLSNATGVTTKEASESLTNALKGFGVDSGDVFIKK